MKNKSSYGINSNKQIIEIIAFFLFTLMATAQVYGQSFKQSLLINKEWKYQVPEKKHYMTMTFTEKEEIGAFFTDVNVRRVELKGLYYLTNEAVKKFQPDLVGKNKEGRYILVRREGKKSGEVVELSEILELTDTKLKIKSVESGTILEYYVEK